MSLPFPESHDLLKGILPVLSCQLLELNSGQEQLRESNVSVLGEGDELGQIWSNSFYRLLSLLVRALLFLRIRPATFRPLHIIIDKKTNLSQGVSQSLEVIGAETPAV